MLTPGHDRTHLLAPTFFCRRPGAGISDEDKGLLTMPFFLSACKSEKPGHDWKCATDLADDEFYYEVESSVVKKGIGA